MTDATSARHTTVDAALALSGNPIPPCRSTGPSVLAKYIRLSLANRLLILHSPVLRRILRVCLKPLNSDQSAETRILSFTSGLSAIWKLRLAHENQFRRKIAVGPTSIEVNRFQSRQDFIFSSVLVPEDRQFG
jgi:hypothetical protein